jgi:hypothetical protein
MTVLATVIHVGVLDVAATTSFGVDAGVVSTLDGDAAVAVEAMVDVHAAAGIVDIGSAAVGAGTDDIAVGGMNLVTSDRGAACGSADV